MLGFVKGAARSLAVITAVTGLAYIPSSQALQFDFDYFGGIQASLNTSLSIGGQWRIQDRDSSLIGRSNLDPNACRSICQPHLSTPPGAVPGRLQLGLEAEGPGVNNAGLAVGGASGINNDNGNLNYDKYEITQAAAQIVQDLTIDWKGWKFFGRYNAFHDFVNYNRKIFYPNLYTPEDRARDDARRANGEFGFASVGRPGFLEADDNFNEYAGQDFDILDFFIQGPVPVPFTDREFQLTVGEQIINWGENTLLVVNSLNTLNPPNVNSLFRPAFLELATVFEPIGAIKVAAPLTLNTSFEAFYQYDWEKVEIPPEGAFLSTIDVTLGSGGEDNVLNPGFGQAPDDPNGNLRAEQELLTAIADVSGRVPIFEENASKGGQYGFAFTWFLPDFNNGTELRFYHANYHSRLPYFSAHAGDESCLQSAPTGDTLTDTLSLLGDCPNADIAHFIGAAAANAGSQPGGVPIGTAGGGALASALGSLINALPIEATGTQPNGQPCPTNLPPGTGPCAEAYPIDSFTGLLEYPEDIKLYGLSFNTAFGDISVQGEIAYRPNLPLQVDDTDVVFAALQPSSPLGCSNGAFNSNRAADCQVASFADRYEIGVPLLADVVDTIIDPGAAGDAVGSVGNLLGVDLTTATNLVNELTGSLGLDGLSALSDALADAGADGILLSDPPGRGNAFPDFLTEYRGGERGNIRPGQYIQGYERFQVLQYNLGATYIIPPGNWIRANQVIMLFELGATHVLGFPELSELQIEGPGTFNHASVGTDGTGAPACAEGTVQGDAPQATDTTDQANTTLCGNFQGARFNPSQQTRGFATSFSYGARLIALIRYENVLPGISFRPVIVLAYDIDGIAPGPGENFIEGRQQYTANVEMTYQQNWSMVAGITVFRGGEPFNLLTDRDFVQLGLRYQF